MKRFLPVFGIGFLIFAFFSPVHAFEISKEDLAVVPNGTVTNGSFLATGKSVTVDGTVNGDLICAAQNVIVNGHVTGDVLCVGQTISIRGIVDGNIRSAAQTVEISGLVRKNISAAGQTVHIVPGGTIVGEAFLAGQIVSVDGAIGGGLLAAGQTVRLNSSVNGGVTVYAQTFEIGNNAAIIGNVTYTSQSEVTQSPGAKVSGNVQHVLPKKNASVGTSLPSFARPRLMSRIFSWPVRAAMTIIFYFIVGSVVALLMPDKLMKIKEQMTTRPWFSGFVGFLSIVVIIVATIGFAITIIGIPIALLFGLGTVLAVIVAKVAAAAAAGGKLLAALGQKKPTALGQVALGVVVIELLFSVPILGILLAFFATLWGLGGIALTFTHKKK